MKKWKTLFYLCLALLIISNAFQFYQGLDMGISMTYQDAEMEYQERAINVLGELIVEGAAKYTHDDILYLLRQKYPEGFIVEEQDKIIYQQIHFKFRNDSLIEVTRNW